MAKAVAMRTVTLTDKVEAHSFTVAQARNGFGDLDQAVAEVATLKGTADRVAGHVMWNAAMVAHNVLNVNSGDYIGAGEGKPWKDQGEFVAKMGFSKGYGTKLKRLGRAGAVHGVKRGSALWTFLASNVGNAKVGQAIALEDSAEALKILNGYMAEINAHGSIKGDARTPQIGDGSEETADTTAEETATPARREASLDDVLSLLDAMVKDVDNETWAAVENRLNRIVEREVTVRTKVAGK